MVCDTGSPEGGCREGDLCKVFEVTWGPYRDTTRKMQQCCILRECVRTRERVRMSGRAVFAAPIRGPRDWHVQPSAVG